MPAATAVYLILFIGADLANDDPRVADASTFVAVHLPSVNSLDQAFSFEHFGGLKLSSWQGDLDQAGAAGAACPRNLLLAVAFLARRCHALARSCASLALA